MLLSTSFWETAKEVLECFLVIVYGLLRIIIFVVNTDTEDVSFGKEFMFCITAKEQSSMLVRIFANALGFIINFMPVYFIAYIVVQIWKILVKYPSVFWRNTLQWADDYLTIKRKI